jgi:hypothetical protein
MGELWPSIMATGPWQMGVADISDFTIFRRKQDRRVDIILNPQWIEVIKSLDSAAKTLHEIINDIEFKSYSIEDKKLIGSTYGIIKTELKLVV